MGTITGAAAQKSAILETMRGGIERLGSETEVQKRRHNEYVSLFNDDNLFSKSPVDANGFKLLKPKTASRLNRATVQKLEDERSKITTVMATIGTMKQAADREDLEKVRRLLHECTTVFYELGEGMSLGSMQSLSELDSFYPPVPTHRSQTTDGLPADLQNRLNELQKK